MKARFTLRLLTAATIGALVWVCIDALPKRSDHLDVIAALAAFVLGSQVPTLFPRFFMRYSTAVTESSIEDLFASTIGVLLGLSIAALLTIPLAHLPYPAGMWLPLIALLTVTPFCVELARSRGGELRSLLPRAAQPSTGEAVTPAGGHTSRVLLDTSAIIDGRIADITATGFIYGELIVPHFVLDELQHIADSPDVLRRNRGRRGLDMLNRMSKEGDSQVVVMDIDTAEAAEVDGKLVHIARQFSCPIITNDFNLNRVAELQGVRVLNINQLANAVKPVVLPGEEMAVHIIQQGKEFNQGVGYLDDGTMIVVEDGQRYINHDVDIIVTRVLQTVAGRMIFAHPKIQANGR